MTSDNALDGTGQAPESTSDKTRASADGARRGARPTLLPAELEAVHADYATALRSAPVDEDTRRAYASRVRQYLAWLAAATVDGDPLNDAVARDWAVRDYRSFLQGVAKRKPATVNTVLAALNDFYSRRGLGPAEVRRLEVAQEAPRALEKREAIRWLRAVEGCPRMRDRALALVPFYAGLRIGETVGLDLDDVRQSAKRGLLVVRAGKGDRYREVPLHTDLQAAINAWLKERRDWPGAEGPALFPQPPRRAPVGTRRPRRVRWPRREGGLGRRVQLPRPAPYLRHHPDQGWQHVVLVADLLGHARLDTTRRYSLASAADRAAALAHLTVDR